MNSKKTRLNGRGYTLIEVLAVIVILGIISAIAIIAITNVIQNMRDQALVGNALSMKEAANFYIQHEIASGNKPAEKLTYKMLSEKGFIELIKDPYTGQFLQPSDDSFVTVNGETVSGVCLKGETRSLCTYGGKESPIPLSDLSAALITEN